MSTLLTANELHFNPFAADRPSHIWRIPPELLELLDNDGKAYFSPEGRAALNRIALGEWFLVKNVDTLEDVLVDRSCRQCGARHPYLSVRCRPAPLNGLRQLHVMLRSKSPVNGQTRPITWREIEVISAEDARRLNQQIRDRQGQPPIDQHPPTRGELEADAIRNRILTRAAHARRAARQAGVRI